MSGKAARAAAADGNGFTSELKAEVLKRWEITKLDLAASLAGQGSIDDIQGGSISYAPEKPGISIVSISAAEPASERVKQSNNHAPQGRSSGAEGEQGGGGGGGGEGEGLQGGGGGAGGGDGAAGAL